jgi:hypothetical protein
VIVGGIGAWSLTAGLLACALAVLVGDIAFSLHPASRGWRSPSTAERHPAGALRGPGVQVLVAVFALCGLAAERGGGRARHARAASGRAAHRTAARHVGAGLAVASFAVARAGAAPTRRAGSRRARRLGRGARALALAAGRSRSPGCCCWPAARSRRRSSTPTPMLDHLAPAGTLTEAFTWTTAGMTAGVAAGAALAAAIVESASP